MTDWHGYLAVEDIALTAPQREAIMNAFRDMGPEAGPNQHLLQFRPSLDGSKAIFEALFQQANVTIENVKQIIADAVGIDPGMIDDTSQQTQYGPAVTFSAGTDRVRFLLFDGVGGEWEQSRIKCRDFIAANSEDWESDE
jgi:hypothetical protein